MERSSGLADSWISVGEGERGEREEGRERGEEEGRERRGGGEGRERRGGRGVKR